jgi:hypothetical protein
MSLFADNLNDEQKLGIIRELVKTMSPEFKNEVIKQLATDNADGECQITVSSNAELVRIDFGKPLAWFAIPKANALQLGASLMEHAGAVIQRVEKPANAGNGNT